MLYLATPQAGSADVSGWPLNRHKIGLELAQNPKESSDETVDSQEKGALKVEPTKEKQDIAGIKPEILGAEPEAPCAGVCDAVTQQNSQ